jgi:hypothetical protein
MATAAQEMRTRSFDRWLAATSFALGLWVQPALAQTLDCAKQPPSERPKCEQAARVAALCGDFGGVARSTCQKHVADTPALEDCARLASYGRSKCETYNQGVLAEYPCAGKAGATLAVCAREQAQKVAQEK